MDTPPCRLDTEVGLGFHTGAKLSGCRVARIRLGFNVCRNFGQDIGCESYICSEGGCYLGLESGGECAGGRNTGVCFCFDVGDDCSFSTGCQSNSGLERCQSLSFQVGCETCGSCKSSIDLSVHRGSDVDRESGAIRGRERDIGFNVCDHVHDSVDDGIDSGNNDGSDPA